MDARAAPSGRMNTTGSRDAMVNLIDGKVKITANSEMIDSEKRGMAVFWLGRMAIQAGVGSMGTGSVMIMAKGRMLKKTNPLCEIGNGGVTDMARIASGIGAANLNRNRSGWILLSRRSHGGRILSRTLSGGKRE